MSAQLNGDAESFLSDFFDTYCTRGNRRFRTIARHPVKLSNAWRAISKLSVVDAELSTLAEAQAVRRGLMRTNAPVRWLIRGTTAVLQIPENGDSYLHGSNESKRTLRAKMRRAERNGFTVSMPASREERLALLSLSAAYEREHPDPAYRNQSPRLDHLLDIRTWLVAHDATGKPLLVAVIPVDGQWSALSYFKTLEHSDNARLARHWLSGTVVKDLSGMGVRFLADEASPIGLPTGLRSFQRRLGYRLVRVRVTTRSAIEPLTKCEPTAVGPQTATVLHSHVALRGPSKDLTSYERHATVSDVQPSNAPFVDVIIVGAGISGIGAAYRISRRNPGLTYAILERRERIGGTWDLFRYPGVRSDSSIYSLAFAFEPWTRPEGVADGDDIREYLTDTARRHDIERHIKFDSYVRAAEWDSSTDTWTVRFENDGVQRSCRSRFVFFASGYFDYDEGYTPRLPGVGQFGGTVVHPQHWPRDLDYSGKKIVVIGSGATAVTLIPALAERAAKVVMLQRSPTYLMSASRYSRTAAMARKFLPRGLAHHLVRARAVFGERSGISQARTNPEAIKQQLGKVARNNLPAGFDVEKHFTPSYEPWDQRMCLILDADLYNEIHTGRAEVVTDQIDHIDRTGITLISGEHLDADIIVTATGLQLQALGGTTITVDGTNIDPSDRFVYKSHMLDDVPNLFWCLGYTNGSWTLRADLTAKAAAKLLAHMSSRGFTHAYPHLGDRPMTIKPPWNISAGYVQRGQHAQPKSSTRWPWISRDDYIADLFADRLRRPREAMVLGRAPAPLPVRSGNSGRRASDRHTVDTAADELVRLERATGIEPA